MKILRGERSRARAGAIAAWVAVVGACGFVAARQGDGARPPPKFTVLAVERASLDRLLVDPKDQPLAKALAMIPRRVRELPHEFPNVPAEVAGVANLVLSTLARPASIVLTYDGANEQQQSFGYGLVISLEAAGRQDAEEMHAQIGGMMAAGPQLPSQPSERWASMKEIATPVGTLSFGPREAKRGWRYEVIFGNVPDPDAGLDVLPKAEKGLEPVVRGRIDLAGLTPVVGMLQGLAAGDPKAGQVLDQLQAVGLWGENALKAGFQIGHTKDESVSVVVMEGAKRFAEAWHTGTAPLSRAELAAIPADATWATIGKADLAWIDGVIEQIAASQPEVEEALGTFATQTGVNLRTDILATLGGTVGFYMSDSTGGGTLGSAVAFISFKDRERLLAAHAKLVAFANAAADGSPIGPGHLRVTAWKDGDTDLFSLRFPGLPVPVELTWAPTAQWLIAGVTPQAVIAAARQANGKGDAGLASSPGFSARVPSGRELISVSYVDTAWLLRSGFPVASMLGSAVSNAVRSPSDPAHEPGLVVPTFKDLTQGVRGSVQYTYWRGDDLVTESHADRSMLVNITAGMGMMVKIAPFVAIPAAARAGRGGGMGMADPRQAWELAALLNAPAPMFVKQRALAGLTEGWLVNP